MIESDGMENPEKENQEVESKVGVPTNRILSLNRKDALSSISG
jgi:hypothetical protein